MGRSTLWIKSFSPRPSKAPPATNQGTMRGSRNYAPFFRSGGRESMGIEFFWISSSILEVVLGESNRTCRKQKNPNFFGTWFGSWSRRNTGEPPTLPIASGCFPKFFGKNRTSWAKLYSKSTPLIFFWISRIWLLFPFYRLLIYLEKIQNTPLPNQY